MEQRKKIPNDKPKLIKRVSKDKKSNNPNNIGIKNNKKITSYNKPNKIPQDSVRKRKTIENVDKKIDNTKPKKNNIINNNNKNIKQRFEEYINEQNKKNINIKPKRFNNIDDAVILIQKSFRNYLNKIHNTNSNLMKQINQRKKNLLENYNNDNQIIINLFQKNNSDKKSKKLNEDIVIDKEQNNINKKKINIDIEDINNDKRGKLNNNINNESNEENKYSVFEKIYIKMQNQEQNEENNNNKENNKFGLDDELIEKNDNIINNQLDMIKNIQKSQIENLNDNKIKEKEDNIITDNKKEIKEEKIEEINEEKNENVIDNKNENINNKDNEMVEDKEKKEEKIKNDNINNENIIVELKKEKNEKEISSKNEIFQRLSNFLDSTVENPSKIIESSKKEEIPPTEISIPKEQKENILSIENTENIGLNLELKEAKKTIEAMSSVINDLKLQLKSKDDFLNKALLSQKNENDLLLQRQNTLTESLLSEKRNMEMQLSELQTKLNEAEKINYKKLQKMRENYENDTRKNKEAWFQAEKIRRKKWEENKIKEIKELTAKGLEPEVEKIISNHKNEISSLEEKYLLEMKTLKEKLVEEYEIKFDEMKKKYIRERDEGIETERNLAAMKLRNQSERLEDEITEERRRWNAKLNSEIQRLESLREKDKKIYEDQIIKLEERNKKNIFSNENFYQKKYDDIKSDYENKLKIEIFNTKKNLEEKNNEYLAEKESDLEKKYREMKTELMKDRDKQINIIIEKLGEESLNERKKNLVEI